MNFTYDDEADALYISFNNSTKVITQSMSDLTMVDIDGDGKVSGIEILSPSRRDWKVREIMERYPLSVNESFFLLTLSERYLLFRF